MSCQIKLTASITDIPAVRRCLFPTDDFRGGDNWLHFCQVSISPTGDLIAIANEKRLVVLTGRWDTNCGQTQFQISFSGCISDTDSITGVLCLPIVAISQSSQVGPDWTCIVIGYESGFVRFYTENCTLLLEEQLHNEPVNSLKCQSQHSPRPDISTELKPEELYVHYVTNVCVINGINLFSTLRNARSQLARVTASGHVLESTLISMNPKKWGYSDQTTINDATVVGLDLSNTFDHLLTASTCGGFETKYRAMAPHNNLVLAAGSKPFVGFHYALEGGQQPVLSDVAKAVASKLKSALPGWLVGNKSQVDKQMSITLQPAESMGCRFGLCDLRRSAISIILSPDRRIAAVSDALGRVTLIDVHKGIILRIFKGYREAQCAFIQVLDERKTKHRAQRRVALFLIIYSQKKGIVEIFSTQQGCKIATFTASKHSRLFYINYGLMGFVSTSKSKYVCSFTCLLVDNDGLIKEMVIPFHFALTEKNSKRARDIHLYKRLKQLIKLGDFDHEKLLSETYNTIVELKTTEVKLQCLEMLLGSKDISADVVLQCVDYYIEKISLIDQNELDNDLKQLKTIAHKVNLLVHFYNYSLGCTEEDMDIENGNKKNEGEAEEPKSTIGAKEMSHLQKLLDLSTLNETPKHDVKVSFHDNKEYSFSEFISIFDLSSTDSVSLKSGLDDMSIYHTAEKVFQKYIKIGFCHIKDFQTQIKKSTIILRDLFKLLLIYWVNKPLNINMKLETEMNNLSKVIYALSMSGEVDSIIVEYNCTSPFWSDIREILEDSARPFPALMAAILCRTVAQRIEFEIELEQSTTSLEEDIEIWEKLSQENCQWTLLIGKLEDISMLNIILANKPLLSCSELPQLSQEKVDVSLKYVMEKGKGSVSELVAQWLTIGGINPDHIVLNDQILQRHELEEHQVPSNAQHAIGNSKPDDLKNHSKSKILSTDSKDLIKEENLLSEAELDALKQPVFEHLNILKRQFPYSLDGSIILANMCWEYALAWQRDIQDISKLEAAIRCLNSIPNCHIKQGLFNLVWNTHLKIIFESSCKLINKVGKLPKERLCRQDTGLTDFQITSFIGVCTNFFDSFMGILQICYNIEKKSLKFEPLWESSPQPLVELALNQQEINYDLLHLHYQLSICILMVATFGIKHAKLIQNLFDYSIVSIFFTDLQNKAQISWNKSDSKMNLTRTQFLVKIITSSIETVSVTDNKIYSVEHVKWMAQCLSLARVWNLDIDFLKRVQVVNLYNSGCDPLGEELLPAISDPNKMGPELLVVCGKRLSNYLSSSQDLAEKITALSPALTSYLNKLNEEWCAPCPLEAILTLVTHCIRCLSETQPEYKLACLMLDACSTLQDIQH